MQAYYRRGDASYALGHFKDAVRDFRAAIRLAPSDPDLRRKVRPPAPACLACPVPCCWLTGHPWMAVDAVSSAACLPFLSRFLAMPPICLQLAEGEKELKRQAFERALAVPDEAPVSEQIVLEDMVVEDSYSGPRMEGATASLCQRGRPCRCRHALAAWPGAALAAAGAWVAATRPGWPRHAVHAAPAPARLHPPSAPPCPLPRPDCLQRTSRASCV